jgi:ribose transport system ATP-binding protein
VPDAASNQAVSEHLLTLRGVSKRFGGVVALDNVDFDLRSGEVHGLIGENGAGKSTMMKLLAGVYSDYEGEMRLGDESVRFSSPADAQRRGIGMVYQELSAFSHLTVAENIFGRNVPTKRGFVDWKGMNRAAQEHMDELGLGIDVDQTMGTLPVGNQQLVEIARVIWSGARSIILDEPTSALSPPETRRLFEFMASLKRQGKTLIFISHFLDDVLEVTDRISVLKNSRRVATLATRETTKHQMVELMIGSESAGLKATYETGAADAPGFAPRDGEPSTGADVLKVEGATKDFAFTDVSLAIRKGEILGLFAFMGAGQTQLAKCLFGAEPLDGGRVLLDDKPLRLRNTTLARAAGIAFVPEDRRHALMMQKEVWKNITIAHLARLVPFWVNEKTEIAIAEQQIKNVGIRPTDPELPVGALSGGNQQKVVLAKWLTQKPRVLILNEPTRGMDVGAKDEVISIIKKLRRDGVAILLITTEPETILGIADRALVMRKGRMTAELSGPSLTKESLMKNA